jgi:hypothetical protein
MTTVAMFDRSTVVMLATTLNRKGQVGAMFRASSRCSSVEKTGYLSTVVAPLLSTVEYVGWFCGLSTPGMTDDLRLPDRIPPS